ncbi:MAG: homocysteine S-methyltransferase family protein [Lentisphaerae bacterium]|nr:homocysteine S-methyltransferase family protein [Lentisphaerota bacterium]
MKLALRLKDPRPLVIDGAMGTQLEEAGLHPGGQNNIETPDAVRSVHQRYVEAGADMLITNTLTLNRVYGEAHGLGGEWHAANVAGARLARAAAGPARYVLGDLSATGQMLEPYGDYTEAQFEAAYAEQARALAEGGVDGFIVETVYDLREALCALRGCRQAAPDLPVLVSMTFQTAERGGRTMMGNTAADCAKALSEAGADAVGSNCGELTPLQMADIVRSFRAHTTRPIMAQPNAGLPTLEGTRATFKMSPDEFAQGVAACRAAGATLLGGCCGTTPAHIHALAIALRAG